MMRWRLILIFVLAVIIGHLSVVLAAPRVIMQMAVDGVAQDGAYVHKWRHAPRAAPTPPDAPLEERGIVRPSPDLAYSACVFDLSKGPVRFTVAPWSDYASLSLYGENTDNFFRINDRDAKGEAIHVVLVKSAAQHAAIDASNARIVESPSTRGIALVRRLAPTPEAFANADAARRNDVCALVSQ